MKKILYSAAIAASVLALSVSCTQELRSDVEEQLEKTEYVTVLKASIQETKTALGDNDGTGHYPNLWKESDVISVNGIESNPLAAEFDDKASAEFSFPGTELESPYYGVIPSSAVYSYSAGSAVIVVPEQQTWVENTYDPSAYIILGTGSGSSINFSNTPMSVFKIVPNLGSEDVKIKTIILQSKSGQPLSGRFDTDFGSGNLTTSHSHVSDCITMTAAGDGADLGKPWYVSLPAGTLTGGFTIRMIADDGTVMRKSTSADFTAERGVIHKMSFTYASNVTPGITASLQSQSSSTASFSWTWGLGEDYDLDKAYTITLADKAGEEADRSFVIPANSTIWYNNTLSFSFGRLTQGKTYTFTATSGTTVSNEVDVTVGSFTNVLATDVASAAVDDVILAEDFGEIGWAGGYVERTAGYIPTDGSNFTNSEVSSFTNYSTEMGWSADNVNAALTSSTRLSDWGVVYRMYWHVGSVKLGTASNTAYLVTPELSSIPENYTASVEVEFTASRYASDLRTGRVMIQRGKTLTGNVLALDNTNLDCEAEAKFNLASSVGWNPYTVTVAGVKKGDRLAIGIVNEESPSVEANCRMAISDVKVTVKSLVAEDIVASAREVSSSTLNFGWTYGGSTAADLVHPYTVQLSSDSEFESIVAERSIPANTDIFNGKPDFCFGGLSQSTTYYFRVKDTEEGVWSNVVSSTTGSYDLSAVASDASAGDVILAEDFHELTAGGENVAGSAAYSDADGALEKWTQSYEVSNTATWSNFPDLHAAGWGYYNSQTPSGNARLYMAQGHVKLGTASTQSYLMTPALSAIPAGKLARIRVDLTAAVYNNASDKTNLTQGIVSVEEGTVSSVAHAFTPSGTLWANSATFDIASATNTDWTAYSVTLDNVSPESHLLIGGANVAGYNRLCVSDVKVTVLSLSPAPPAASFVAASSSTLNFTWTYGISAADDCTHEYKVQLAKDSDFTSGLIERTIGVNASEYWDNKTPVFCFGGLSQSTTYYFRVQDTTDEVWSRVISEETTSFDRTVVSSDAGIGDVILAEDFGEADAGGENVVGAAGYSRPDEVVKKWSQSYTTNNTATWEKFTGLRDAGWGYYNSNSAYLYMAQGHVKLGTGKGQSYLVTPVLSAIPATKKASVHVEITAAVYNASEDRTNLTQGKIGVSTGSWAGTGAAHSFTPDDAFGNSATFDIVSATKTAWTSYSVDLDNVTTSSRLIIGADNNAANNRLCISDVKVTITALSDL